MRFTRLVLAIAVVSAATCASAARANTLTLNNSFMPDVEDSSLTVSFNGTHFSALDTSAMFAVTLDGSTTNSVFGSIDIEADISSTGVLSGGTITINDTASSPLITGTLTDIGFGSTILNFTFDVTGGAYQSVGAKDGLVLNFSGTGVTFDPTTFTAPFTNVSPVTADAFGLVPAVPLPNAGLSGALLLASLGAASLVRLRKAVV